MLTSEILILCLYFLTTLFLAIRWLRFAPPSLITKTILLGIVYSVLLLVPFQLLGVIGLSTHQPVVTIHGAEAIAAVFLLVDLVVGPSRLPVTKLSFNWADVPTWGWGLIAMVLVILIWVVRFGLGYPPCEWDSVHYHLPRALNFMQRHSLIEFLPQGSVTFAQVENALGYNACHAYPGNWSLFLSLLTRFRSQALLSFAQFPFLLLSGLIAFRLARIVGARILPAVVAMAAVVTAPLVLTQGVMPYADLYCSAFLLGAALLLFEYSKNGSQALLVGAGLSLGMSIGSKPTALIYALLLSIIAAFVVCFRERSLKRILHRGTILMLATALPCAFWFIQNWILYGSPVVPFQIKILGIVLFPGKDPASIDVGQEWVYVKSRWDWLAYPWTEKLNNESGFGWLWTTLLPIAAYGMLRGLRASKQETRAQFWAVAAFSFGSLLLWWKMTHHEPRYVMHLIGLVAILGAYGIQQLQGRFQSAACCLVALGIVGNGLSTGHSLMGRLPESRTRYDFAAMKSRTPASLLAYLDRLPPTRLFNEKHGMVQSTVAAYALYGSKFQHSLLENQNLVVPSVESTRRNLVAQGVEYLYLIARSDDPYLTRYSPQKGFQSCFSVSREGVTHVLYRLTPRRSNDEDS